VQSHVFLFKYFFAMCYVPDMSYDTVSVTWQGIIDTCRCHYKVSLSWFQVSPHICLFVSI